MVFYRTSLTPFIDLDTGRVANAYPGGIQTR